jgi:hypothetical protein
MPNYPVINFLLRHGQSVRHRGRSAAGDGRRLPRVLGLGLAGCRVGGVVGVILYVLAKSYVELVAVIADMLLPK